MTASLRTTRRPEMWARAWLRLALAPWALVAIACAGNRGDEPGKVVVDGSSTVFRISRLAQLGYFREEPEVTVHVGNHGTGGGFGRYLHGEVDLVNASRDAKPEEIAQAEALGMPWTRFVIGYDGITVAVNPANKAVESLSVEQLRRLYASDSRVRTWRDLDPRWPDQGIVLYAPDMDSGTFEYFHDAILGPEAPREQRPDVQPSPDDNVLVRGVEGDFNSIGYFGFAYYLANPDGLKALAIQEGPESEPVRPTRETIGEGRYRPLSRPLFLFVRNEAMARPEVAGFVRYYLDHVERFATKAGYVPPNEADRQANASALASVLASLTSDRLSATAEGTE